MSNGKETTVLPSTRIPLDLLSRIERFQRWMTTRAKALSPAMDMDRPDAVRDLLERGLRAAEVEMDREP